MIKTNKKTIALLSCLFLLTFLFGYALNPLIAHHNPTITANVEISENVGGVTAQLYSGNVITDLAETIVGNVLAYANETTFNYTRWISLSNDASPSAAWTELPNESTTNNFTRALGTVAQWTNSGDYAYNVTYTFTATGTEQLQCAGLHWVVTSDSNNNLFAAAAFTQTTFNSGDTLTVKWSITVNAN